MGTLSPEQIPPEIVAVCHRLREAGHQAFLVGGAVRDHLRAKDGAQAGAKDFDIATAARPEQVIAIFGKKNTVPTGLQHGTVTVLVHRPGGAVKGPREHVEVTTFRGEGAYSDGRRPDEVTFIDDLVEDLRRRDFTINAIAYDPIDDQLVDPFGGAQDLARRLIRAVGDPAARFSEDGLRTMRAVRFAAQLQFPIDEATAAAIPGALPTLAKVSGERIRDELLKLLSAPQPSLGLQPMADLGLLGALFEEVPLAGMGMLNRVIDALPPDGVLRLGALLWPLSEAGAMANATARAQILDRLRLPSRDRDRLLLFLAAAPVAYDSGWSDAAVRRFLAATPAGLRADLFAHKRAIYQAADSEAACPLEARCAEELLRKPPLHIGDLALSGKEVMELLGISPGPRIGEALRALLSHVLDDPSRNTKEALGQLLRGGEVR